MEIEEIFLRYIEGSLPATPVHRRDVFLGSIEPNVHATLRLIKYFMNPRAYISTISIKHIYDRRPRFVRKNIGMIRETICNPDIVVRDIEKKGDFIFVRKLPTKKNRLICCPVEICERESGHMSIKCITFFPTKSKSYIEKFPTVWDREGGLLLHHDKSLARSAQQ